MTLEEAHKMLDEEYEKGEAVQIGFRRGKVPDAVRVAGALIKVTETAKKNSPFFEFKPIKEEE